MTFISKRPGWEERVILISEIHLIFKSNHSTITWRDKTHSKCRWGGLIMDINLLRVLCSWGSVFTCLDIYSESGGAARWEPAEVELCSGEKRNQCLSNQVRMCVNEWEGDQFNSKYENNRGCGGHTEGTLKENAWMRKWNSIWGSCFISVRQVCDTLTKFHELRELSGVAIVSR